jgi:hypothetical protein
MKQNTPIVIRLLIIITFVFHCCLLPSAHSVAETGNINNGIKWIKFEELDKASKLLVKLDEDESTHDLAFAYVRLKEHTPIGEYDSLILYNYNSTMCGSGGCALQIFTKNSDRNMREIFTIVSGSGRAENGGIDAGISLGKGFTKGMRNLRFEDQVTWIWNGREYALK